MSTLGDNLLMYGKTSEAHAILKLKQAGGALNAAYIVNVELKGDQHEQRQTIYPYDRILALRTTALYARLEWSVVHQWPLWGFPGTPS